jgi:uncharacterized protein (TIGR02679 family)
VERRLEIFHNEPGFHKLFIRFREKYRSLGRLSGSVKMNDFSDSERDTVAGFLGVPPDLLKVKGAVSVKSFEQQLAKTNLEDFTLMELLETYFGEPLLSKVEEKNAAIEEEKVFYEDLIRDYPDVAWWFQRILQKKPDTRFIQALYKEDKNDLVNKLILVAIAFQSLPSKGRFERIPIFAQRVSGNPHSFDRNQFAGKLLLHMLAVDFSQRENVDGYYQVKQTEEVNELLLQYGLLRDDLWSFVTCRGFTAMKSGVKHPVWESAAITGTVLNIPVRELVSLDKIEPLKGKAVWVLENSGVCSAIMDVVEEAAVACTHGQFKVASWIFFEKLIELGCTIYYSGDIDPEGLLMADRLKKRYPENVVIWRMDKSDYLHAKSEESIEDRITQLKGIEDELLKETAFTMINHGVAAYQEGLIDLLIEDIRRNT